MRRSGRPSNGFPERWRNEQATCAESISGETSTNAHGEARRGVLTSGKTTSELPLERLSMASLSVFTWDARSALPRVMCCAMLMAQPMMGRRRFSTLEMYLKRRGM